tara:strand:- start:1558 stop:2301 length:744 start_codon:yes stop_codon:yes gene_type:complete
MAVKCDQLIYSPVNALTFRITGGTKSIVAHSLNKTIQSLEASDNIIFEIGQIVTIKHLKYKIKYITKKRSKGVIYYDLSMAKRTKSSTFIMPMLGGSRRLFFWTRLFLNCFIRTEENKYCIALLYRHSEDPLFIKFENALRTFKDFKKIYDPSDNTILFVFNIPSAFKKDFKHFMNGRYSKLSPQYKINILEFHNQSLESEIGQVLYRDPERKIKMENRLGVIFEDDVELLSILNINEETLKIENYV